MRAVKEVVLIFTGLRFQEFMNHFTEEITVSKTENQLCFQALTPAFRIDFKFWSLVRSYHTKISQDKLIDTLQKNLQQYMTDCSHIAFCTLK